MTDPIKYRVVKPCRDQMPCLYCCKDKHSTFATDKQVSVCQTCKWATYCNTECMQAHASNHLPFCQRLERFPQYAALLNCVYACTGLFPIDDEWHCVPILGCGFTLDVALAVAPLNIMGRLDMLPVSLDWMVMCLHVLTTNNIIQTDALRFVSDHPAIFQLDQLTKAPTRIATLLAQSLTSHHTTWFGLAHPSTLRNIGEFCRRRGIDTVVDPLAGNGMFAAMLPIFAETGTAETMLAVRSSDIAPQRSLFSPVDAADATARSTYPHNPDKVLVVISWPDPPSVPEISSRIIRMLRDAGFANLLVFHELPGTAMSVEGHAVLEEYYVRDASVVFTPAAVYPDLMPRDSSLDIFKRVGKFGGMYTLKPQ